MNRIWKAGLSLVVATTMLSNVNAQHQLPKLVYSYSSMQPYIDSATMDIHYNKHHAGYVNNLNKAIKGTPAESLSIEELVKNISKYETSVRNNGGGHYNHTLFWSILTPIQNTKMSSRLEEAIIKKFGSIDEFKSKFEAAASSRFGSGWAWLSVDKDNNLFISSTPNQDNPLMDVISEHGTPILGIDVWEHAYYLNYQNRRADYLKNMWNVINWVEVSERYNKLVPKGKLDDWAELIAFHKVMSETYHAAEDGDLAPIKKRSNELYQAALLLNKSKIPAEFNNKDIHKTILELVQSTLAVDKLVKKGASDKKITTALNASHDIFHNIVGLCKPNEKH